VPQDDGPSKSALWNAAATAKEIDVAIKSLTARGRVEDLRVLAGYDPAGAGVNADRRLAPLPPR
jgi:hypothetical protein